MKTRELFKPNTNIEQIQRPHHAKEWKKAVPRIAGRRRLGGWRRFLVGSLIGGFVGMSALAPCVANGSNTSESTAG